LDVLVFVHPLEVIGLFEDFGNEAFKVLEVGLACVVDVVYFVEQVVDDSHDEVVVVACLPVLEDYFGVSEVVVFEFFDVVNFFDEGEEFLVDFCGVGEGVLCSEVGQDPADEVGVDGFEVFAGEDALLVESRNVLEDVLAAEYLGLLETHVPLRVLVEGRRKHRLGHFRHPLLQHLLLYLLLCFRQPQEHFLVPRLNLVPLPQLLVALFLFALQVLAHEGLQQPNKLPQTLGARLGV